MSSKTTNTGIESTLPTSINVNEKTTITFFDNIIKTKDSKVNVGEYYKNKQTGNIYIVSLVENGPDKNLNLVNIKTGSSFVDIRNTELVVNRRINEFELIENVVIAIQ